MHYGQDDGVVTEIVCGFALPAPITICEVNSGLPAGTGNGPTMPEPRVIVMVPPVTAAVSAVDGGPTGVVTALVSAVDVAAAVVAVEVTTAET